MQGLTISSSDDSLISPDTAEVALIRACFENVLSYELIKVFNPAIIGAILGYKVPTGLISNDENVDLKDFTFPLDFFRKGFYIDANKKLQRREGLSVYLSKGNDDGDRFFFSSKNFTSGRLKEASHFFEWLTPDLWESHVGDLKSIKLESKCSVKNCPATRSAKFDCIQIVEEGSKNFGINSVATPMNGYEVVFKQS